MRRISKDTKVRIEFDDSAKNTQSVECYVVDIQPDRLILSFPADGRKYLQYLGEGESVKAYIYSYSGILILNPMIIEAPKEENLITIEFKEEQQVIQRRQYFRICWETDFSIIVDGKKLDVRTIDVSGGGVRFLCKEEIKTGEIYKGALRISSVDDPVELTGRVFKKNPDRKNEYVFEYTQIEEKQRERIIKKCVLIERERIRKY